MKDDIILNTRAHSLQAGEQLHARSVHSIFPKHQLKCKMASLATEGNKKRHKPGDKRGNQGHKGLGNKDTPSKKGKQEGRQALRQEGQGRQSVGNADTPSIQQRETRSERSWETSGETS